MRERGEMNHPSNHPLARPLSRRYRRPAGRIRSKLEESPFLRKQKNDEVRFQPFALQVSRELSDLRSFDASSKLSSSRRSSSRNEDRQGFASPLSIDKINKPPNDGILSVCPTGHRTDTGCRVHGTHPPGLPVGSTP